MFETQDIQKAIKFKIQNTIKGALSNWCVYLSKCTYRIKTSS